jgi:protein-tyrosine phosphatase
VSAPKSRGAPESRGAEVSVLLVCMGNICRSPTAEAVLRAKLERAGLAHRVRLDSAGTHAYHVGEPPDRRARATASARGYDAEGLRARQLHERDREFDLILAMDRGNLRLARRVIGDDHPGLGLYLDDERGAREVPDPYGAPSGAFESVLDMIETGADTWVAEIARRLDAHGASPDRDEKAPSGGSGT